VGSTRHDIGSGCNRNELKVRGVPIHHRFDNAAIEAANSIARPTTINDESMTWA
jgi:hypothetical protein